MWRFRFLIFIICGLLLIFNAAMIFWPRQIARLLINARAGCFPWSPREVEYHDGMTIFPGQSARMTIIIAIPKKEDTGI